MVFITAEIGINHNGNIEIAKKLIDVAKECNCNAVKFQKRTIETVYSKEVLDTPRDSPWGTTTREQKLGLEFNRKEYDIIDSYCKQKQIQWYASAWDIDSQLFLRHYNLKYNKVASSMLTHTELLKLIAEERKHTFISTGMSTLEEIKDAIDIFRNTNCPFELLHTNSSYPMKIEEANLKCMQTLREKFNCDVGYSGHEAIGYLICVTAVILGASSIERHISLDRSMYGSDQPASLEPRGLRELVSSARKIEISLGTSKIGHITKEEYELAKKLRAHIKIK